MSHNKNSANFWKNVRALENGGSMPSLPCNILNETEFISDKNIISDVFSSHFIASSDLFNKQNICDHSNTEPVPTCDRNDSYSFTLRQLSVQEVSDCLISINPRKSKGADLLEPKLLQIAALVITSVITHIFNLTLLSGKIPKVWKAAHVLPLHKGGDSSDPNNYRPISKLSCLVKILERLISVQLHRFLVSNSILNSNQSGCRPRHSTVTAACKVVNDIVCALDKRQSCVALFIDLSKAFDTVDHTILMSKLCFLGFDNSACAWFQNYLSDRTQAVVADGYHSSFLRVTKGLPQGSILGPILFTLYINNLDSSIKDSVVHLYADDTIIYSIAPSIDKALCNLKRDFVSIQSTFIKDKLVLNPDKTNFIIFSRSKVENPPNISLTTLNGIQIKRVITYKYLGIWLDENLSFKTHIEQLSRKLKIKLGFLYRNKQCLSIENRLQIVQTTFLSVLDYAETLKPLDALYHSALRFITGDGYQTHHCILYEKVGWPSLSIRREQHCLTFIYKAILNKLPFYLTALLKPKISVYSTRAQEHFILDIPFMNTELGKTAFFFFGPHKWNTLQNALHLTKFPSVDLFKHLLTTVLFVQCTCFN